MRNAHVPGSGMVAATRAATARVSLVLALLVPGAVGLPLAAHAAIQGPGIKAGVAAFDAGDFDVARSTFEPLAKADNSQAEFWLGRMYENGLGVDRNVQKAVGYYRKAANAGWEDAKLRLGEIYLKGNEKLQDYGKARKWLERAALDGSTRAQRDLGKLYAKGRGVHKDPVWAYVWYEFAAKQGDYDAQQLRDGLIKSMTTDQLNEAQKLAQDVEPEVLGHDRGTSRIAPGETEAGENEASTAADHAGDHTH